MILDQAANLELLVKQAMDAAGAGNRDAALAAVGERMSLALRQLQMYGVAKVRWRSQLLPAERDALARTVRALREALTPLEAASEDELAAYGSNSGSETRGGLATVARAKDDVLAALEAAQTALLSAWLHALWPRDEQAQLEVLGQLPEGKAAAAVVLRASRALAAENDPPQPISTGRLEELDSRVVAAQSAAGELIGHRVPVAVVNFWRAASEEEGTSLAQITGEVLSWLVQHNAADEFGVCRR